MSKIANALSGISDEAGASIDVQIKAHLKLGWKEIELRSVNGIPLYQLDRSTFEQLRHKLSLAELKVTAVASSIGNWGRSIHSPFADDIEELKILSDRMNRLGGKYVRIMSYPNDGLIEEEWRNRVVERMYELSMLAETSDIVLLHENCAGWGGISAENTLYLIEKVNHPALRLLFDTGNGIAYHYNSYEFLQKTYQYVEHVHIKDGLLQNEETVYTFPGQGHSQVKECLQLLKTHHYKGIFSIEPHLHLIPHLGKGGTTDSFMDSYIEYGHHLEALLDELSTKERIHHE
ncbi:sugar phosphate isomerase/epimerase family protein [Bacillus changyiensis]|uniref:sugar phosphate isomerase/epimerase family protein n=1 Tax=Bacillus changyiensis TaxID=3004103 RepID=UPI0022E523A3|nr:sugar phosphate isomerase/epimerase family protein [Bacillus changyiensis]MDA1478066.1 sugar phosphate isomerase/epimerase [Bacillus changyiensis]